MGKPILDRYEMEIGGEEIVASSPPRDVVYKEGFRETMVRGCESQLPLSPGSRVDHMLAAQRWPFVAVQVQIVCQLTVRSPRLQMQGDFRVGQMTSGSVAKTRHSGQVRSHQIGCLGRAREHVGRSKPNQGRTSSMISEEYFLKPLVVVGQYLGGMRGGTKR